MSDPFKSSRTRIRWAKHDLAQFDKRAKSFFRRAPYARIVEADADPAYEVHKFKLFKPLPDVLTNRTVNIVENLRSALDHAAVAVGALANVSELDEIHFPFCKTEADIKSRINSACRNLPDEIKALFTSLRPYKGGEEVLWAINELCKASKHRLITPVAMCSGIRFQHIETFGGGLPLYINEGLWRCENNEVILARIERGLQLKYHVKIAMAIQFGEVEVVAQKEVFPILQSMIGGVTGIIDDTEAECRKIGLLSA